MGWFVGISTRTPTTSISFTATPSSPEPHVSVVPCSARGTPLSTYTPSRRTRTPARAGSRVVQAALQAVFGDNSRGRILDAWPQAVTGRTAGTWHREVVMRRAGQASFGQRGVNKHAVQPQQQRRDLARGPARRIPRRRAALAQRRRDDLLDQRHVPVGRR